MAALTEARPIDLIFHSVTRMVRAGGVSKQALLAELQEKGIELNEAGQALFAHDSFRTSATSSLFETVEVSIADLGCVQGATFAQIHQRAVALGLRLCPLELGPHLRLQFLDQMEEYSKSPPSQHRAPPGSITVASQQPVPECGAPNGFYLRRIQGILWLRGYWSSPDHIWSPEDRIVFRRPLDGE